MVDKLFSATLELGVAPTAALARKFFVMDTALKLAGFLTVEFDLMWLAAAFSFLETLSGLLVSVSEPPLAAAPGDFARSLRLPYKEVDGSFVVESEKSERPVAAV